MAEPVLDLTSGRQKVKVFSNDNTRISIQRSESHSHRKEKITVEVRSRKTTGSKAEHPHSTPAVTENREQASEKPLAVPLDRPDYPDSPNCFYENSYDNTSRWGGYQSNSDWYLYDHDFEALYDTGYLQQS